MRSDIVSAALIQPLKCILLPSFTPAPALVVGHKMTKSLVVTPDTVKVSVLAESVPTVLPPVKDAVNVPTNMLVMYALSPLDGPTYRPPTAYTAWDAVTAVSNVIPLLSLIVTFDEPDES